MYNATRTLFPAYAGLGDIKVSLPTPPSRRSINRDIETLWDIHVDAPHVEAITDPGLISPLPDNGFNPETDLSEISPQNILVNRGATGISRATHSEFVEKLNSLYHRCLEINQQFNDSTVGEVKELMVHECSGSLLIYNGTDRVKLIKALSLVQALEKLSEAYVNDATFPETSKAQLLAFIGVSQGARDALLLPNNMIRQRILGNTSSIDLLDNTLSLLGLSEIRSNPDETINDQFKDYREALRLADLDADIALNKDIHAGFSLKAIQNCKHQVLQHIKSPELKSTLNQTLFHCADIALKEKKRAASSKMRILVGMKSELTKMGIDPQLLTKLNIQEQKLTRVLNETPPQIPDSTESDSVERSPHEIQKALSVLTNAEVSLKKLLRKFKLPPKIKTATNIELYSVMCLKDSCVALSQGGQHLAKECGKRLHQAILSELKDSSLPQFQDLNSAILKAKKDLQYAQKSVTMENLKKAQSENLISDIKLETLTKMIG